MSEMVKVHDPKTNKITLMPKEELAPGMIQAEVDGLGLVWIDSEHVTTGRTNRHGPFGEDVRQKILALKAALDEVLPKSYAKWEGEFRRDSDPDQEIATWERIAAVYQRLTKGKGLSKAKRENLLQVLLSCSMSPRTTVLEVVELNAINRTQAQEAIDLYFDGDGD